MPLDLQAERDVFRDGHMGEQRVFLENGVELPAVGRQMGIDILAVEDDLALIRVLKSAQDPKRSWSCRSRWGQAV